MNLLRQAVQTFTAGILLVSAGALRAAPTSLTENFDSVAALSGNGWFSLNNSSSAQASGAWNQALSTSSFNPPQSGADGSCVRSLATATGGTGTTGETVNDWLLTPVLTLTNGSQITFYSRCLPHQINEEYPERLQVRMSSNGSTNVGVSPSDVGDYSTILLEINPTLTTGLPNRYPDTWTQYTITISGLSGPLDTRIAFRHFVTDSGANGPNGDGIAIDSFSLTSAPVTDPYQTWKEGFFTVGELADGNISGDNADADGDGVSTLLEYAFGTNPKVGNSANGRPQASVASGNLVLSYRRPAGGGSAGVTYAVEVINNADLIVGNSNWTPALLNTDYTQNVSGNGDGTETVTITFSGTVNVKKFGRIAATYAVPVS